MIEVRNLNVRYESNQGIVDAVRDVSFKVGAGQFYTLLGPSGCGKTTTLRCVAGLETPRSGEIDIAGELVYSSARELIVPTYRRDIGMVFQSYAIWPHMTVFENVAFPLQEMRPRLSRAVIRDKVRQALELVQLADYENRPAPYLSGGQQQRLALARALVREPKVLLLDEPLSNLDAKLRESMRLEVRALVKRLSITTIYVTHDQLEALTMSDVVAVMNQGRITQEASPLEIYRQPQDRFIANFIGLANFIEARVSALANGAGIGEATTASATFRCVLPKQAAVGDDVVIVVRPEDIYLAGQTSTGLATGRNIFEGEVTSAVFLGDALDVRVQGNDAMLHLKLHPSNPISQGDRVSLELPPDRCVALAS